MADDRLLHSDVTETILNRFYHVYNTLGFGFLEKVYENSLAMSLRKSGLVVDQQLQIPVLFEGESVGEYFADLRVQHCVLVEVKAAKMIDLAHESQLLNYLRATSIEVGLLLNFGPKPEFRRKAFANDSKAGCSESFD